LVQKRKFKVAVVLTIIGWIILAAFFGVLAYCLCNTHVFHEKNPIQYAFLAPIPAEICLIVSFFLNKCYRKERREGGLHAGKLCTFIFIITIIGLLPIVPALIVGFVGKLIIYGTEKISDILPKGVSETKINIVDDDGDKHQLVHTSGRNYKDENGEWWTSYDGKKFTKD